MLLETLPRQQKHKGYLSSTNLVLIAFATAFFARILQMLKIPSAINFMHFAVIPFAFGVAILKSRSKNLQQLKISRKLLFALLLLLTIELASALVNDAGIINVLLHFLLFTEPFMLLLAIVCIPMSATTLSRFRTYILGFGFTNLIFALIQKFILKWDTCSCAPGGWTTGDAIMGVFVSQGAGGTVSASVSLSLAIYYFITEKHRALWLRALVPFAALVQIVVGDNKQVLLVGAVAYGLLALVNLKDIAKAIILLSSAIFAGYAFWWAANTIFYDFLWPYLIWVRPDIYGPDGEATLFKLSGVNTIIAHIHSPINWWLGLGPGHTVDRLGGWMFKDYADLLNPLGATQTTIATEVWTYMGGSWLANGTTMFMPFFGWAAIWGDLGFVGLGAYLYICWLIWQHLSKNDLAKFLVLCIFVNGWIQTGLQEPGFMLFNACLIGICWHEAQLNNPN